MNKTLYLVLVALLAHCVAGSPLGRREEAAVVTPLGYSPSPAELGIKTKRDEAAVVTPLGYSPSPAELGIKTK